jgi:hypothetical protein
MGELNVTAHMINAKVKKLMARDEKIKRTPKLLFGFLGIKEMKGDD